MFKTVNTQDINLQITKQVMDVIVRVVDDFYDLSMAHSKRKGVSQLACERSAFIGYLCEGAHYAMHDIYGFASSFYNTCKENDDNIIGKHLIKQGNVIVMNFNLFNSLDINIPYASLRASDFCWEVFSDIKVTPMERYLWNIELQIDMDLIRDHIERFSSVDA